MVGIIEKCGWDRSFEKKRYIHKWWGRWSIKTFTLHSTTHNRLLQATTIQIHLVDFQRQTQHFNVMLSNVSFCTRTLSYVNEILPFLFLHCLRWTTETDWKFWCALQATISSLAEWFSKNLISLNSSTSIKTICATLKHWLIPNIDIVLDIFGVCN